MPEDGVAAPALVRAGSLGGVRHQRLTVNIGAEIFGLGLGEIARDDDLFAEIRALWLKHKVLFFRDQDISRKDHWEFARRFGALEGLVTAESDREYPEIIQIYRSDEPARENAWHSDGTWREDPPTGAVLRCLEAPAQGGDTMWANMAKAYADLPDHVKDLIGTLYARHSMESTFGSELPREERRALFRKYPDAEHPVVVTHPETQEKILYVSSFTTHFTNFFRPAANRFGLDFFPGGMDLLTYLILRASIPEYQVRWKWTPNSVAVWDNRACQHLAVQDYWPAARRMERATIAGQPLG